MIFPEFLKNTEKIKYLYGKVTGKYKNGLDIAGGRGTDITAASTANVYIYDQGGSIHQKLHWAAWT